MPRFKKIYIETTNVCNLSCNFCPKTERKLGFMSSEEFKEVIEKVKNHTDYVYFHLMGEPLLNKSFVDFIKIANQENINVNITTNGTLINKIKDIIINEGKVRQINISLHSFEANNNDINFDTYINDILDFIVDINSSTETIVALRLWNMDTEELKANNNLNSNIINLIKKKLEIDFDIIEAISQKRGIKIRDRIYLNMDEKFSWPDEKIDFISDKVFCQGLRDHIGILVDGTVVPCCLDSNGVINLGNIFESSLDDIISSERAKNIFEGFSRREAVEDLCKRCGFAKRKF